MLSGCREGVLGVMAFGVSVGFWALLVFGNLSMQGKGMIRLCLGDLRSKSRTTASCKCSQTSKPVTLNPKPLNPASVLNPKPKAPKPKL